MSLRIFRPSAAATLLSFALLTTSTSAQSPPKPPVELDAQHATGVIEYLYATENLFYFRLATIPEVPIWFRVAHDSHLAGLIQQSAANKWPVGVYYEESGEVKALSARVPDVGPRGDRSFAQAKKWVDANDSNKNGLLDGEETKDNPTVKEADGDGKITVEELAKSLSTKPSR